MPEYDTVSCSAVVRVSMYEQHRVSSDVFLQLYEHRQQTRFALVVRYQQNMGLSKERLQTIVSGIRQASREI